jgi:rubrerythrin
MEDTSKSDTTIQKDTSTQILPETINPEDLDSRWLRWKCLNCGYLYEGMQELRKCPRCGNENPDLFEDAD